MREIKSNGSRATRRSTSSKVAPTIQSLRVARLKRSGGRFETYGLLEAVYRTYIDWKRSKIVKRSTRKLANEMDIARRRGMSPIRVLIESTLPSANLKQKSRWVRALEYVHSEHVPPSQFRKFVRRHGGLAGCARLMVGENRKRRRPRRDCVEGDWDD